MSIPITQSKIKIIINSIKLELKVYIVTVDQLSKQHTFKKSSQQ